MVSIEKKLQGQLQNANKQNKEIQIHRYELSAFSQTRMITRKALVGICFEVFFVFFFQAESRTESSAAPPPPPPPLGQSRFFTI